MQSTERISVQFYGSTTLWVVNNDCDLVDTSVTSTLQLKGAKEAVWVSYYTVVDKRTNVYGEDTTENGCMSNVEGPGEWGDLGLL